MSSSVRTYGFGSVEKLVEALRPWQGGRAQVLGYLSPPGRLDVWLTKPEGDDVSGPLEGGLLLQCLRCASVHFLAAWGPFRFQVEGEARGGNELSLEIHDVQAFHVRCWDAQVTGVFESVESLSAWRSGKRTSTGPALE